MGISMGVGCVLGGCGSALGMIAVVSAVAAATVSPAEAKRRIHRSGGYNPPYTDMIVDAKTGKVLHAENEDSLRHPASVTKVMTLFLLVEQLFFFSSRRRHTRYIGDWSSDVCSSD